MIQQLYEYVSSSLWHHLMLFCADSPTGGDWKRVNCHGNRIFIVVGVFSLELLAYQVSMVCDTIDQDSSINILYIESHSLR